MNELQVFENNEFGKVRAVMINNESWLVGKDVVEALGYNKKYYDVIKQHCYEEDYILIDKTQPQYSAEFDYKQLGQRGGYLINESGLYSLVFGSELDKAKQFKHWVTSEVLPTIRKHGAYMTEQTLEQALTSPDFLIKLATQLKEEQEARKLAEKTIAEQRPFVEFAETVTNSSDCIDMNEMAKLLKKEGVNIGRNKLFEKLRELNILMNNNQPYQEYMNRNYFKVIETTKHTPYGDRIFTKTVVTGRGQVYIVQKIKKLLSEEN